MVAGGRTFLNLVRGHRLRNYVGITEEVEPRFGPDYTYLDLPLENPELPEVEGKPGKFLRNQMHTLSAGVCVRPAKAYKVLVTINPELHEYADCPAVLVYHHEGSTDQEVRVVAKFRKDMPVDQLDWMFRVSLME